MLSPDSLGADMRRREFITLLGGAAAAWPLAVRAQERGRVRRIGVLTGLSESELRPLLIVFREKLKELGWLEGSNIIIEVRTSGGDLKRMIDDAGAIVGLNPDVILAVGTPGLTAVSKHSRTVPVVFVLAADPVKLGLIESLARPGGNATGFTNFEFSIGDKWLEILKGLYPQLKHVTLIANPDNLNIGQFSQFIERTGRSVALNIMTAPVRNPVEIEAAITTTAKEPDGALIIIPDSLPIVHRDLIIGLAARHRLPAIYPFRIFPSNGGLVSYGLDFNEVYRQGATYVARILEGEKPADLPVPAPNKFELVINVKTAKALGLEIPAKLLALADEVIE
jgi:putative tryptophan/tyrosine transport system substrate-binding protein